MHIFEQSNKQTQSELKEQRGANFGGETRL